MTTDQPEDGIEAPDEFDAAQQRLLVEIGQALIARSTSGAIAVELSVTRTISGQDVNLDVRLNLERQSGLTVPATADDMLVALVQRLVVLWRQHNREPWQGFGYRLTRGETGPRFTSEFTF